MYSKKKQHKNTQIQIQFSLPILAVYKSVAFIPLQGAQVAKTQAPSWYHYRSLAKEGPMDFPPISQFCLDFLLSLKLI